MKFKSYLNETFIPKENILKILQKNCGPFLNELKKHLKGELLYTGRKNVPIPFAKKQVRSDRKPTDTPKEIHQLVDGWFYKKFGIRARSNAVFATPNESTASKYGRLHSIFPIGDYKIIWSKSCKDLYVKLTQIFDNKMTDNDNMFLMDYDELTGGQKLIFKLNVLDWLDKKSKYQMGMSSLINWDVEVMISCKEYYLVDVEMYGHNFIKEL